MLIPLTSSSSDEGALALTQDSNKVLLMMEDSDLHLFVHNFLCDQNSGHEGVLCHKGALALTLGSQPETMTHSPLFSLSLV